MLTFGLFFHLTVDDHFLGVGDLVLQRGYFTGVVPGHIRRGVIEIEGSMSVVRNRTDLKVQVHLSPHGTQTLQYRIINSVFRVNSYLHRQE